MKNITLDHTTVLQLDVDGTDNALDCHSACNFDPLMECALAAGQDHAAVL